MINVLLADDHTVVRAGYRHLLQSAPDIKIIAEADTGEEAYRICEQLQPDVTVMDISMPGMGGLEALRRIRAQNEHAKVLIFSMHDDAVFPSRALEAGARGYLSKSCSPEALIQAVRTIAAGSKYIGQEVAHKVALQMSQGTGNLLKKLTPREFETFTLLAQGVPLAALAEQQHIDYKTVTSVQARIRQKLGIENTAQLVMLAIRSGVIKV
ncbi:MAG: response regulator transcription factor [Methylotenera sp.]|uniref:response regulator n=1 Tax=Methylotenera sp. TaxID=2051956 RepID=UPI0027301AA1|nr:response regulator transcription factor [Methylotenera sp.]MDP1523557.1 response regulator transcription factor [Methylotenera sp.]MDP1657975.1 response regulator transcription factor [Methylotenera sp.]MDP3141137.1 response regulator transcription factor [Methylotenera sp.]MDP3307493.1 response regulator transcription factor [Methylotenera sp.]MDZ4211325.1 response regulator transcription factor [Methylotenera sp.]